MEDDILDIPTYQKGDRVIARKTKRYSRASASWSLSHISEGDEVEITVVKTNGFIHGRKAGGYVLIIPVEDVRPMNVDELRVLGTVPEGMISPDDPGLAWLWEDAAKLADRTGQCPRYDQFCDNLGIPGRERDFTVKLTLESGSVVTSVVKARSRKLAEAILREELAPLKVS